MTVVATAGSILDDGGQDCTLNLAFVTVGQLSRARDLRVEPYVFQFHLFWSHYRWPGGFLKLARDVLENQQLPVQVRMRTGHALIL